MAVAGTLASGEITLLPSQYVVDEWTSDVGLPEETAAEMVRVPNDHLMIATAQGVVRFDGQRFETLYPDRPKAFSHSIIWTPEFGVECVIVGFGVAKVDGRKIVLRQAFPSPSTTTRVLRRDQKKRLMLLFGNEVYREESPGGPLKVWRRLPAVAQRMLELPDGSWLVAASKQIYRVHEGQQTPELYHELSGKVEALTLSRNGTLYIGTSQGLFRQLPGSNTATALPGKLGILAVAESSTGELWVGTERGLYRLESDGNLQAFNSNLRLRQEPISTIFCDEDGSVWAAYVTGGLFRLRRPRFANWSPQEGLTGGVAISVQQDGEGGAWVTGRAGVHHITNDGSIREIAGDWKTVAPKHSVLFEKQHKLWVLGGFELREVDTVTGKVRKLPLPLAARAWFRLHKPSQDECWLVNLSGKTYVWRDGAWVDLPLEGMPSPQSTGAIVAGNGTNDTWIAMRGVGFFRATGNVVSPLAQDQPERQMVHAIYPDREGHIWLGLDGAGIGIFEKGRIKTLAVDRTLQLNSAYLIAEDTFGYLWFGLRSGMLRIAKRDLLAHFHGELPGPVPMARYTAQGGLPSGNFGTSTNVNHPTPAATLWLPHLRGLMRVDTASLTKYRTAPTPHIDQVLVDDVPQTIEDGAVSIPAGAQRVTIGYHGTFLPEPMRVMYRYQLDDFQSAPTGPYSQREATFTELPPGSYEFRLWTANSDGVWNTNPLRLRVNVAPAFYQTWMFRVSALACSCFVVYGAFAWRTRLLRRDKEELENRVESRTRELQEARVAAETAAKVKSEFLATMSHEIRTPLHGVLGTLELLAERQLDGEEREYVRTAKNSGESLLELLNDVLDLSRLEAGHPMLQPEEFAFPQLCRDVVEAFRHAATVKGLDLRLNMEDVPPNVFGDPSRLRQILSNLVGNAIKFTDQGWVELCVRATPNGAKRFAIRFSVKDTGVGIDPSTFDVLFQPFSQVDGSSKRRYSGTGLGLAICQRLCEEMGGHISVVSQLGKGAEFLVDIVLPGGADAGTPHRRDLARETHKLLGRVLLVEDNRVNQLVASRMLTRLGCTFDIAHDGVEGVELAAKTSYHAILMDCHMPRATGPEATLMIRAGAGVNSKTPIIALTAGSSTEERSACIEAGMDGFLTKPYSLAQLHSILSPHLEHESDPMAAFLPVETQ